MKLKHIIKKESGQAMVEFALVLPILLLFIGGIIDFGWIFHNQILVNNATREVTRFIAINYYHEEMDKNPGEATTTAEQMIINKVGPVVKDPNVVDFEVVDDPDFGKSITVTFTGKIKILTPILSTILGEDYNLKSICTMRVEDS